MQVDMTKARGATIATAFLRGMPETKGLAIDSVICAYTVSIPTAIAERRAMMLHQASAVNGFTFRAMVRAGMYTFNKGCAFN